MAMSACFISIFLLLFEMKAAWDICRDYLLSKQQLSIERQEAERGFRKNLFKSCMYVCLLYNSNVHFWICESWFSIRSRSGRIAVEWQQRGGANADTTFEFPIYGSRDAALWWPLGCLGGAGQGMVGEVELGPRWNVNFLRSMRPEPGPGQSGQQGAAILTSNIQYSENMPTTAIFQF